MKVYLDVCCLNRPFDDQSQERVYLESEAILSILRRCNLGEWQLLWSSFIDFEVSKNVDNERKQKVLGFKNMAVASVQKDEALKLRALFLASLGFSGFDASHIACAEKANADVFLSTDDKLLKIYARHATEIKVSIMNPLKWIAGLGG